jgi:serpin B
MSYLLNAIYFKADWASKFDQNNTREETFAKENGSTELPMMHQNVLIQYLNNDIFSAVKIPYGSGLWNMMVLLPEEGKTTDDVINHFATCGLSGVEGLICQITEDNIATMKKNYFSPYEVDLKLPRFETSSDTDKLGIEGGLVGLMKKMGINLAFDSYLAEIPNMCELPVYIAMMRQKAKIKVNEEGSEAAAVTVAGMKEKSSMGRPVEYPKATFHANRPFVYVIQEASSGVILFIGKFTGA